jgi:hypothetical protein
VPSATQVPRLIGPLFRAALGSAEAQQRVHLRRVRAHERHQVEEARGER